MWVWSCFKILVWSCPGSALPRTALHLDSPNFRSFFPLSRRKIRSFLPSLGGPSRGILVVFLKDRNPQMCTFGLSGCCVKPAAALPIHSRQGFTRQPESSKRAHLTGPRRFKTPPKFQEKTPREGRKERILRRESEKKKREILAPPPTLRAPTLWAPPPLGSHSSGPPLFLFLGPHPSGSHPSGPHPSEPTPLELPLSLRPTSWVPHAHTLVKNGTIHDNSTHTKKT